MTIEEKEKYSTKAKKDYLNKAKSVDNLINSRLLELQNLRRLSVSLSSSGGSEAVASSGKETANYTKIVEKIIDLENQIDTEIDEYIDTRGKVKDSINKLEDNDEKAVLINRFINNMGFKDICKEMNISERNIYIIYDNALKNINI